MNEETFYTIPEAAAKLRVTRAAIYKWMKEGRLRYVIVGSERRVTGSAIDEFVRSDSTAGKSDLDTEDRLGVQSEDTRTPKLAPVLNPSG